MSNFTERFLAAVLKFEEAATTCGEILTEDEAIERFLATDGKFVVEQGLNGKQWGQILVSFMKRDGYEFETYQDEEFYAKDYCN